MEAVVLVVGIVLVGFCFLRAVCVVGWLFSLIIGVCFEDNTDWATAEGSYGIMYTNHSRTNLSKTFMNQRDQKQNTTNRKA